MFTPEQEAFILKAHYRSGVRQEDGSWAYSLNSCLAQYCENYRGQVISRKIFAQQRDKIVAIFEGKTCICKGKAGKASGPSTAEGADAEGTTPNKSVQNLGSGAEENIKNESHIVEEDRHLVKQEPEDPGEIESAKSTKRRKTSPEPIRNLKKSKQHLCLQKTVLEEPSIVIYCKSKSGRLQKVRISKPAITHYKISITNKEDAEKLLATRLQNGQGSSSGSSTRKDSNAPESEVQNTPNITIKKEPNITDEFVPTSSVPHVPFLIKEMPDIDIKVEHDVQENEYHADIQGSREDNFIKTVSEKSHVGKDFRIPNRNLEMTHNFVKEAEAAAGRTESRESFAPFTIVGKNEPSDSETDTNQEFNCIVIANLIKKEMEPT